MNWKIAGSIAAAAISIAALFGIPAAMAESAPPSCGPGQHLSGDGQKCLNNDPVIVELCVYLRLHGGPTPENMRDPKYADAFKKTNNGITCIDYPPATTPTATTTVTTTPQEATQPPMPTETHLPVTH